MSAIATFTVAEFDHMIDHGVFDFGRPRRVELIRGVLRETEHPATEHYEATIDALNEWSMDNAPRDEVRVRIQNTLGIPELESVTVPDVAWVKRRNYVRLRPRAQDVLLLVEVSDSSIRYDRNEKGTLYASIGIEDYWIVNIPKRCVEVYRQPAADGYDEKATFQIGDTLTPLKFPHLALPVELLFPPQEGPDE